MIDRLLLRLSYRLWVVRLVWDCGVSLGQLVPATREYMRICAVPPRGPHETEEEHARAADAAWLQWMTKYTGKRGAPAVRA